MIDKRWQLFFLGNHTGTATCKLAFSHARDDGIGDNPMKIALLSDIHALGIADGALLWPLLPGTAELIGERAFEAMHTMGALPESRSA